jgi:hypothetical protein
VKKMRLAPADRQSLALRLGLSRAGFVDASQSTVSVAAWRAAQEAEKKRRAAHEAEKKSRAAA